MPSPFGAPACKNCFHRNGTFSWGKCGATGYYMEVERKSAGPCGYRGLLWTPKPARIPGLFERGWRYLFGGEALGAPTASPAERPVTDPGMQSKASKA